MIYLRGYRKLEVLRLDLSGNPTNQELTEQIHVLLSNYNRIGLTNRR